MTKMTTEKILEYYKNIPEITKEMRDGKHADKLTDYIKPVRIKELAANKAGFSLLIDREGVQPTFPNEAKKYWVRFPGMILSPCCIMAIERAKKDGFNPTEECDNLYRCSRCKWCPLSGKHRYKNAEYQCRPNWEPELKKLDLISPEEELHFRLDDQNLPLWMIEKSVQKIMDGIIKEI